ncbi:MAG TPA: hypothetical protein VGN95_14560 [Pyrinomonadaceae bacterium]|jgi:hypothetical protein|nr:hypothetical protein [Pyrinomonadaceae bacterium]
MMQGETVNLKSKLYEVMNPARRRELVEEGKVALSAVAGFFEGILTELGPHTQEPELLPFCSQLTVLLGAMRSGGVDICHLLEDGSAERPKDEAPTSEEWPDEVSE